MKAHCFWILIAGACSACAQGLVDFRNGPNTFPTTADRRVYAAFGLYGQLVPLAGTNFVAGLWFMPGADNGERVTEFSQAGRTFTFRPATTTNPGVWLPDGNFYIALGGVQTEQSATLQVRVWDSVKHASFAEALAAGEYGMSAPFNYTVPPLGAAPSRYYMDNLRAFALVPEPSSWVLLTLAISGFWWCRRKRRS